MFAWTRTDRGDDQRSVAAAYEFIVAAIAVTILLKLTRAMTHLGSERATDLAIVLALAAAAAGATSAILSRIPAQLREDPRSLWLCLALLLYTLVALPAATIGSISRWDEAAVGNIRLFAHAVFVLLTYLIATASRMPRWFTVTTGMLGLLTVATAVGWLGELYPTTCLAITTSPVVRWGLLGFWLLAPLSLMVTALCQRSETLYRAGLALEIVAVAHAMRVNQGSPSAPLDLTFSLTRLLGILLLLCVASSVTRQYLSEVDRMHREQQEQLRRAQTKLQRVRERDHELRNGLAGLAGAARYIQPSGGQSSTLHRAVAAELGRLNTMMRKVPDSGAGDEEVGVPTAPKRYSVEEVLNHQVELRRSTGMDIRLDTDPRLHAAGSPTALAQVISNLLANCARHAPASPVRIQARDTGSTVTILVSDSGPGIPERARHSMFQLGARGTNSAGQGIGLHVSERLIRQDSGTISIVPARRDHPGCTVMIELPVAPPDTHRMSNTLRPPYDFAT